MCRLAPNRHERRHLGAWRATFRDPGSEVRVLSPLTVLSRILSLTYPYDMPVNMWTPPGEKLPMPIHERFVRKRTIFDPDPSLILRSFQVFALS
jgi:hypothetical protein